MFPTPTNTVFTDASGSTLTLTGSATPTTPVAPPPTTPVAPPPTNTIFTDASGSTLTGSPTASSVVTSPVTTGITPTGILPPPVSTDASPPPTPPQTSTTPGPPTPPVPEPPLLDPAAERTTTTAVTTTAAIVGASSWAGAALPMARAATVLTLMVDCTHNSTTATFLRMDAPVPFPLSLLPPLGFGGARHAYARGTLIANYAMALAITLAILGLIAFLWALTTRWWPSCPLQFAFRSRLGLGRAEDSDLSESEDDSEDDEADDEGGAAKAAEMVAIGVPKDGEANVAAAPAPPPPRRRKPPTLLDAFSALRFPGGVAFAFVAVDGIVTCATYLLASRSLGDPSYWQILDIILASMSLVLLFGGLVGVAIAIANCPLRFVDSRDGAKNNTAGGGAAGGGGATAAYIGSRWDAPLIDGQQASGPAGGGAGSPRDTSSTEPGFFDRLFGASSPGTAGSGAARHVTFLIHGGGMWKALEAGGHDHEDTTPDQPPSLLGVVPQVGRTMMPSAAAMAGDASSDSEDDEGGTSTDKYLKAKLKGTGTGLAGVITRAVRRITPGPTWSPVWTRRMSTFFSDYNALGRYYLVWDALLTCGASLIKGLYYAEVIRCLTMVMCVVIMTLISFAVVTVLRPYISPLKNATCIASTCLLFVAACLLLAGNVDPELLADPVKQSKVLRAAENCAFAAAIVALISMVFFLLLSLYRLFVWVGFESSGEGAALRAEKEKKKAQKARDDYQARTNRRFIPSDFDIPTATAESDLAVERKALVAAGMLSEEQAERMQLPDPTATTAASGASAAAAVPLWPPTRLLAPEPLLPAPSAANVPLSFASIAAAAATTAAASPSAKLPDDEAFRWAEARRKELAEKLSATRGNSSATRHDYDDASPLTSGGVIGRPALPFSDAFSSTATVPPNGAAVTLNPIASAGLATGASRARSGSSSRRQNPLGASPERSSGPIAAGGPAPLLSTTAPPTTTSRARVLFDDDDL